MCGKVGLPVLACRRRRRVGHEVVAAAVVAVAPDVAQAEEVADLVGRGAALVERRHRPAPRSERAVEDDHAVGLRRAPGELGVAEQAAAEVADPDVQVAIGRPGRDAAGLLGLDGVVGTEGVGRGRRAGDAGRGLAGRVLGGQGELDLGVQHEALPHRWNLARVGVLRAVILVERDDLALDLRVGDVLLGRLVHDVHDDRQRDELGDGALGRAAVDARRVWSSACSRRSRYSGCVSANHSWTTICAHVRRRGGSCAGLMSALPSFGPFDVTGWARAASARPVF